MIEIEVSSCLSTYWFSSSIWLFLNEDRSTGELHLIFKVGQKHVMEGIELVDGIKIRHFTKQDIANFKKHIFMPIGFSSYIST
jgi:hypothetical protein